MQRSAFSTVGCVNAKIGNFLSPSGNATVCRRHTRKTQQCEWALNDNHSLPNQLITAKNDLHKKSKTFKFISITLKNPAVEPDLSAVTDLVLSREIRSGFDRSLHPFDGEKSGQVCRVRRDDDQGEEPPEAGKCSSRHGTEVRIENLFDDYKTTKLSPAKLFYQNSYKGI